jgi:hypothetical protein
VAFLRTLPAGTRTDRPDHGINLPKPAKSTTNAATFALECLIITHYATS